MELIANEELTKTLRVSSCNLEWKKDPRYVMEVKN